MPFQISETLLAQLRAYRVRRSAARDRRNSVAIPPAGAATNFLETVQHALSGAASTEATATGYVHAMDSWENEVEKAHDAFLLYPGMGPMLYLTVDGRILEDSRGWDGDTIDEVTGYRANAALVTGARVTGIVGLLDLIEAQPPGAQVCPTCEGSRLFEPFAGLSQKFPCDACGSRGWVARP